MPRNSSKPEIVLCLSVSGAARAMGLRAEHIREAILMGHLDCRSHDPSRRRVPVFGPGGLQEWFATWPRYIPKPRKPKKVSQ